MKKMLTLLAVATIPAMLSGCAACCPTGLCPCCPCNWFNRGAPCPPAPVYAAPLAAAPVCPPAVAPTVMPQYVAPMAAPLAAAPVPCAPGCATWNPCQGVVMSQPMMAQPQAATCCPPQNMYAQPQPVYPQAQPAYYTEPTCGYVESSCGAPFAGMVSYGPEMPVEYGPCDSGCCDGGVVSPPAPEAFIDPRPVAE